jgi:hypothetical protein
MGLRTEHHFILVAVAMIKVKFAYLFKSVPFLLDRAEQRQK